MCIGGESYEAEALLIPAQRDARGLAIPPSAAAWAAAAAAIALHDEATCVTTDDVVDAQDKKRIRCC